MENSVQQNEGDVIFGSLKLTKDEVIQSSTKIGKKFFKHVLLRNISSVQMNYKSSPIFIVIAVLSILFAFWQAGEMNCWGICIAICIVAIILYYITRKHAIIITAFGGDKIVETISAQDEAEAFVDNIIKVQKR